MKERYGILIVDDEGANLEKLKRTFLDEFQVYQARSGEEALSLLRDEPIVAVITDQKMQGLSGVELLRQSLEVNPDLVRIILTGYTEVEDLMDAINQGHVHRYITKPWEPSSLKQTVKQDLERWELKRENERLNQELKVAYERLQKENFKLKQEAELLKDSPRQFVYRSRSMRDLLMLLDRVVQTDSTVLIQGETGTGKELLARYIHDNSLRSGNAFIAVNCGAVPADLVESAFFGHKKGAFTGASEDRKGYFELGHRGTLFLDEISEAPLELQVKLLRVLQEGEVFPVGAQGSKMADVRLIASTNRNLSQQVEKGDFRQDLFFRLNVFSVWVPPLRARTEDIQTLAQYFLQQFRQRLNKHVPDFEPETLKLLNSYDWPGNVRELENEIERMVILSDSGKPLSSTTVSERIRQSNRPHSSAGSLKQKVHDLERRLILDALQAHNQNKSHAALSLGISRQTLIAKLKSYHSC